MKYDKVGEDENEEEDFTRYIYIVLAFVFLTTTRFFLEFTDRIFFCYRE